MALTYERIDIKLEAGARASLPIDPAKTALQGNDFIADTDIQKLKPAVVVTVGSNGFVKPATEATDAPLGFLVNDVAGYANQNINAQASGLATVLVGNGNQFVTDNIAEGDVTPGALLYAGTNGVLTKTKGTLETPVAVALTKNSASNKAILVQTLI